ncbi:flagellar hook-length control protein FliK [Ochrobactrum soli]|uniref:Flagellar hook-length control protein FliK n=1 Tax=Ochrobactrum soli TaxID=2448455 RepID=A0A849KG32_9HYPH|nr:flagellar hook-length control protein FliK [[Ochrobactrum] soli]NNU60471.1 flagellar hook-length control protein FliK [[Ochrobactrum] soli]
MSVDILLGQAGRMASPTRSLAPQQNGQGKAVVDGPENSDPSQLFGALLEKPHGKPVAKGDDADTALSDEPDEQKADVSTQGSNWAVTQNILSLAANMPNLNGESHNSATENLAKKSGKAALAQPDGLNLDAIEGQGAEVGTDAVSEVKRKAEAAQNLQPVVSGKPSSKSGEAVSGDTNGAQSDKPTENADANLTDLLKAEKPAGNQPANSSNADRGVFQPLQAAGKSAGPVDGKVATATPQAVRVADVQVVSERSFGSVKTLQIRLDPVDLGQVTARIRVVPDGVEVHLVADKAQAAEALSADRSIIEKALKSAGIADDARISVTVTDRAAASAVQHTAAGQGAGQQQAGAQQQSSGQQQAFNMQGGFDGRNGAQSQAQAQFASGEGRQNGDSSQTGQDRSGKQTGSETAARDTVAGTADRSRGLVV